MKGFSNFHLRFRIINSNGIDLEMYIARFKGKLTVDGVNIREFGIKQIASNCFRIGSNGCVGAAEADV